MMLPTDDAPFLLFLMLTQTPREFVFINEFKNCRVLTKLSLSKLKNELHIKCEGICFDKTFAAPLFVFIISTHDRLEFENSR